MFVLSWVRSLRRRIKNPSKADENRRNENFNGYLQVQPGSSQPRFEVLFESEKDEKKECFIQPNPTGAVYSTIKRSNLTHSRPQATVVPAPRPPRPPPPETKRRAPVPPPLSPVAMSRPRVPPPPPPLATMPRVFPPPPETMTVPRIPPPPPNTKRRAPLPPLPPPETMQWVPPPPPETMQWVPPPPPPPPEKKPWASKTVTTSPLPKMKPPTMGQLHQFPSSGMSGLLQQIQKGGFKLKKVDTQPMTTAAESNAKIDMAVAFTKALADMKISEYSDFTNLAYENDEGNGIEDDEWDE